MSVGGSIQECSIAGRIFAVAADGDSPRDLGGKSNEVQMNGNKTARVIKTIKPGAFENLVLSIDDRRGDQEHLQQVSNGDHPGVGDDGFVDVTVTYASGITYGGRGMLTGDIKVASQNTTATVNLTTLELAQV